MAYCTYCGTELPGSVTSCGSCGQPTGELVASPTAAAVPAAGAQTEGFAIASLVSAIGGVTIVWFIGSILAIVFGQVALSKIKADPTLGGEGIARAGLVLGWIGVGLTVLGVLVALFVFALFFDLSF